MIEIASNANLEKKSEFQMGFEPTTLHFTHSSPLLAMESAKAQWLEHPTRYRGLWVQIPSGTRSFQFSEFSVDAISII